MALQTDGGGASLSVRPREEEEELRRRGDQSDFWHLRRKAEEGPKSPPLFSFSRPTASISLSPSPVANSLPPPRFKNLSPTGHHPPPLAAEGKRKTTRRGRRTHRMFGSESCPSLPSCCGVARESGFQTSRFCTRPLFP